jgi:hypothetical protein
MKTKSFARLLLICSLLVSFLHVSLAQMSEGKVRFGLKAGVTGANLYDDSHASDIKSRLGFEGGGFAKIPMGKHFSLRPEVLFALKGATYNFSNNQHPDIKLGYVEIPLSLELSLLSFLNFHAGIHANILTNADGKLVDANGNTIHYNFSEFEKLDYGWHLGGGLDIGNIGLHLRISRGLHEISKNTSLQDVVGNLKNAAWALTFSLAL